MFNYLILSNTAVCSFHVYTLGYFCWFCVAINCLFPLFICLSVCVGVFLETQKDDAKSSDFKNGSKTGG